MFQITASPSARSRQLWRRTGNFFQDLHQFYVYDLRFKAGGLTTFLTEFWTLSPLSFSVHSDFKRHIKSSIFFSLFPGFELDIWKMGYCNHAEHIHVLLTLYVLFFFRENINIYMYLHFMSFLHINKTQVVEIPPRVRQGAAYSTKSISWLLMSWGHKEPGHQQPWYWPS